MMIMIMIIMLMMMTMIQIEERKGKFLIRILKCINTIIVRF